MGCKTKTPLIAAISGWCVGGAVVMVMMCDLVVSSTDSVFTYPEAGIGLTGGMIASLVTRMPHKIALEFMLLGRKMTAQRAYEVGFINEVVTNGKHEKVVLVMAEKLVSTASLVVSTLKQVVEQRCGRLQANAPPSFTGHS